MTSDRIEKTFKKSQEEADEYGRHLMPIAGEESTQNKIQKSFDMNQRTADEIATVTGKPTPSKKRQ